MGSYDTADDKNQQVISAAKQRWKILARAVTGDRSCDVQNSFVSVRRFQCYGLFQAHSIEKKQTHEADWYNYTSQDCKQLSMNVRHLRDDGTIKPETLLGFNNTGNICIWPSEEVMAYHCLQNVDKFRNKSIIELGGGMTCLAGMALAVCSEASRVVVTDGNEDSLRNLNLMIDDNEKAGNFNYTAVSSRLLRWGPDQISEDLIGSFDFVLCADCFFFDEGRSDLVDLVHSLLRPQGQAVMFAPHRGHTLQAFVALARSKFSATVSENYDKKIYGLHQKMRAKGLDHYDENIHYPVFVELEKAVDT